MSVSSAPPFTLSDALRCALRYAFTADDQETYRICSYIRHHIEEIGLPQLLGMAKDIRSNLLIAGPLAETDPKISRYSKLADAVESENRRRHPDNADAEESVIWNEETAFVFQCAVRYELSRHRFFPWGTSLLFKNHSKNLPSETALAIANDIDVALSGQEMSTLDVPDWQRFSSDLRRHAS